MKDKCLFRSIEIVQNSVSGKKRLTFHQKHTDQDVLYESKSLEQALGPYSVLRACLGIFFQISS